MAFNGGLNSALPHLPVSRDSDNTESRPDTPTSFLTEPSQMDTEKQAVLLSEIIPTTTTSASGIPRFVGAIKSHGTAVVSKAAPRAYAMKSASIPLSTPSKLPTPERLRTTKDVASNATPERLRAPTAVAAATFTHERLRSSKGANAAVPPSTAASRPSIGNVATPRHTSTTPIATSKPTTSSSTKFNASTPPRASPFFMPLPSVMIMEEKERVVTGLLVPVHADARASDVEASIANASLICPPMRGPSFPPLDVFAAAISDTTPTPPTRGARLLRLHGVGGGACKSLLVSLHRTNDGCSATVSIAFAAGSAVAVVTAELCSSRQQPAEPLLTEDGDEDDEVDACAAEVVAGTKALRSVKSSSSAARRSRRKWEHLGHPSTPSCGAMIAEAQEAKSTGSGSITSNSRMSSSDLDSERKANAALDQVSSLSENPLFRSPHCVASSSRAIRGDADGGGDSLSVVDVSPRALHGTTMTPRAHGANVTPRAVYTAAGRGTSASPVSSDVPVTTTPLFSQQQQQQQHVYDGHTSEVTCMATHPWLPFIASAAASTPSSSHCVISEFTTTAVAVHLWQLNSPYGEATLCVFPPTGVSKTDSTIDGLAFSACGRYLLALQTQLYSAAEIAEASENEAKTYSGRQQQQCIVGHQQQYLVCWDIGTAPSLDATTPDHDHYGVSPKVNRNVLVPAGSVPLPTRFHTLVQYSARFSQRPPPTTDSSPVDSCVALAVDSASALHAVCIHRELSEPEQPHSTTPLLEPPTAHISLRPIPCSAPSTSESVESSASRVSAVAAVRIHEPAIAVALMGLEDGAVIATIVNQPSTDLQSSCALHIVPLRGDAPLGVLWSLIVPTDLHQSNGNGAGVPIIAAFESGVIAILRLICNVSSTEPSAPINTLDLQMDGFIQAATTGLWPMGGGFATSAVFDSSSAMLHMWMRTAASLVKYSIRNAISSGLTVIPPRSLLHQKQHQQAQQQLVLESSLHIDPGRVSRELVESSAGSSGTSSSTPPFSLTSIPAVCRPRLAAHPYLPIYAVASGGVLLLWDAVSSKCIGELSVSGKAGALLDSSSYFISAVDFAPSGAVLLLAVSPLPATTADAAKHTPAATPARTAASGVAKTAALWTRPTSAAAGTAGVAGAASPRSRVSSSSGSTLSAAAPVTADDAPRHPGLFVFHVLLSKRQYLDPLASLSAALEKAVSTYTSAAEAVSTASISLEDHSYNAAKPSNTPLVPLGSRSPSATSDSSCGQKWGVVNVNVTSSGGGVKSGAPAEHTRFTSGAPAAARLSLLQYAWRSHGVPMSTIHAVRFAPAETASKAGAAAGAKTTRSNSITSLQSGEGRATAPVTVSAFAVACSDGCVDVYSYSCMCGSSSTSVSESASGPSFTSGLLQPQSRPSTAASGGARLSLPDRNSLLSRNSATPVRPQSRVSSSSVRGEGLAIQPSTLGPLRRHRTMKVGAQLDTTAAAGARAEVPNRRGDRGAAAAASTATVAAAAASPAGITAIDWDAAGRYIQAQTSCYEVVYCEAATGFIVRHPQSLRELSWATTTVALGWQVRGIWDDPERDLYSASSVAQAALKTRSSAVSGSPSTAAPFSVVSAVARTVAPSTLVVGTSDGRLKVVNYPAYSEVAPARVSHGHDGSGVADVRVLAGEREVTTVVRARVYAYVWHDRG